MLLLKNLQFLPNNYETRSKLTTHEYLILTEFQIHWVKIVDFLMKAYVLCKSRLGCPGLYFTKLRIRFSLWTFWQTPSPFSGHMVYGWPPVCFHMSQYGNWKWYGNLSRKKELYIYIMCIYIEIFPIVLTREPIDISDKQYFSVW